MINDIYIILGVYTLLIHIIILMMLFTIITLILSLSSFSALLQNYVDHTTATSWLFLRVALLPTETFLATALQSQC